jgi:uncharacterized repeat protein (TIGR01451 family)
VGPNVTDSDDAVVDVINPRIDIAKTPDLQTVVSGSTVLFTIVVTNTGDVALDPVAVNDPLAPSCNRANVGPLAPGQVTSYTCTVANVTADFTNVATATGTPPVGPNVTDSDDAVVDVINPRIDIAKTPDLQTVASGSTVLFTIVVTNTGDVTLNPVAVSDPLAPSCNRANVGPLAPGQVTSYTCSVTNVTADFTNVATATGTPPVGPNVTDSDDAVVDVIAPNIDISKTPDLQTVVSGSTVLFTIVVTNTGDVTLNPVVVSDPLAASCNNATLGPLAPGQSKSYQCSVSNVTADFTNVATVTGTPPVGPNVTDSDDAVVDVINPRIDIAKTPDLQTVVSGSTVLFTIVVTNTGDVALDPVAVNDPLAPSCNRANVGPLAPGQVTSYTCSVTNVTADFTNVATATGTPPVGPNVTDSDDAVVDVIRPAVDIAKTPDLQTVPSGSTVTFTIRVTNTGDVTLNPVAVNDTLAPNCNRANVGPLAPGQSTSYTCTVGPVTASFTNVATATGTPPVGPPVTDSDDARVNVVQLAAIGDLVWYDVDKDGFQDPGEPGIGNVVMALYTNGTLVTTTTTGIDGGYIFDNLAPGTYTVTVVSEGDPNGPLAGFTHFVGNQSQPNPTGPITIAQGQFYQNADFGYYLEPGPNKAVIGDTVWYDYDSDGVRDPGEPGIPGVTVVITDSAGTVYTGVTDINGLYQVVVNANGVLTYTVVPQNPPAGAFPTTPVPHYVPPLAPGSQYLEADFGYNIFGQLGTIGNQIWVDSNVNGKFDGGEPGIPGVSVNLYRDDGDNVPEPGELVATTVTDLNGQYLFQGLPTGNYLVVVSDVANVLAGYVPTIIIGGTLDNDNKAQPYAISLPPGANNVTADFGYIPNPDIPEHGIIGNQVWFEMDGDGIFEPQVGEIGLDGLTVELYRNGQLVDTQVTGASGIYAFTDLPGGVYTVTLANNATNATILAGLNVTQIWPNNLDNFNKAQPYTVNLPSQGINMTADFGYTQPSDYVIDKVTAIPNPDKPVKVNDPITFTIRITNTGESWIETLPLVDTYDTRFLAYLRSTPPADGQSVSGNVGTLIWNDLTGASQVPPGGTVTLTVVFRAMADTTDPQTNPNAPVTINTAGAFNTSFDPDGPTGPLPPLPAGQPKQDQDDAEILNPTSVALTMRSVQQQAGGVSVRWATENESLMVGFTLYRQRPGAEAVKVTSEPLMARYSGEPRGDSYEWLDSGFTPDGDEVYILEIELANGSVEYHTMGSVGGFNIFMPAVVR